MNRSQTVYLVVSPRRGMDLNVRVAQRAPRLDANEVSMELTISVPDAMFKRPQLEACITIPEDAVNRPTIQAGVLDNIKLELQRQLGVDISVRLVDTEERE